MNVTDKVFIEIKKGELEKNHHPMYKHVNATLEERVEILAENPFRYYIEINVFSLSNMSRIEEINKCMNQALQEQKYELFKRILEVKKNLIAIYEKK